MKSLNIMHVATGASFAGVLALAAMALASSAPTVSQSASTHVTDPASLPKFANVIVVNATPAQIAAAAQSTGQPTANAGMRAYIDPATKQLRAATPDEMAANAAASKTSLAAPTRSLKSAASATFSGRSGGTVMRLDDSFLSYEVAKIGDDGVVRHDCVGQQPNGKTALSVKLAGEDSHEK